MKNFTTLLLLFLSFTLLSQRATVGFTENKGQFRSGEGDPRKILFRSVGTSPQMFITTEGLTYVFHGDAVLNKEGDKPSSLQWSSMDMRLEGADISVENVVAEDQIDGYSNYYYPWCVEGITNVKSYHKVTIRNVYPGIDWVICADEKEGMYHDFIVHEGADASLIHIRYPGAEQIRITDDGKLEFISRFGSVMEGKLKAYVAGSNVPVKSKFRLVGNSVYYKISPGKTRSIIIIDPPLQWFSRHASSDFDYGYACSSANDASGDVVVTGTTMGTNFPVMNAYQGTLYGFQDLVIFRLNSAGTTLWSTYYGGLGDEEGKGVSCDASGNAYIVGATGSSDMPVLNNVQANYGGGTWDVAALKFSASGVRQWATWIGGLQNDYGTGVSADVSGNMYFTGYTNSNNYPVAFAPQPTKGAGYDAVVTKLSSSGAALWSTFFGADDDDKGRGICLDAAAGNAYITGSTLAGTLTNTSGSFQSNNANAYNAEDAFILKISSGHVIGFASYFGGTDADFGQGITVDVNGNIFVAGYTLSSDLPVLDPGGNAYFDNSIGAASVHDGFVLECNNMGTAKIWSTYFGGTGTDMAFGIHFDPGAGIYICGNTSSTDFPAHQPVDLNYYQSTQGDGGNFNDMFMAWFGLNDSLSWSTYYGGTTSDEAYGVTTDAGHNIFVAGVDSNDVAVLKFNNAVITSMIVPLLRDDARVYPVPAIEELHLQLNSDYSGSVKVEIMDEQGRVVLLENYIKLTGTDDHVIDVKGLVPGNYLLRYGIDGQKRVIRFIRN